MSSPYSSDDFRGSAEDVGRLLGYGQMNPQQLRVVESFLKVHNVFGVLPTGFGKSLCYACLSIVFDKFQHKPHGSSIVLTVSPFIAIIKDQLLDSTFTFIVNSSGLLLYVHVELIIY